MSLQTFHYGLRDLKIAAWNGENTYGTERDILGAREMTATLEIQAAELEGDDIVLDQFAKVKSVTLRISYASVDQEVLSLLTGGTLVSNADYEDVKIGANVNETTPFFAIAGKVVGSPSGDLHIFIPKAKLSGNLQYQAQLNNYLIPQADFRGVWEGATNGIIRFRKFPSPTGLHIPLATQNGAP